MNRRQLLLSCGLTVVLLGGCSSWNPLCHAFAKPGGKGQGASEETQHGRQPGRRRGHARSACSPCASKPSAGSPGLHGTGSDPEPSPQRAALLEEMQRRGVENPNALLASNNASLVLVRGRAASRHSERRPLRRRGPRARPQRDHQLARRLPVGDPADGHGRARRRHAPQSREPRHRARARPGRSHGRRENEHGSPAAPRAGPRRRHVLHLPLPWGWC